MALDMTIGMSIDKLSMSRFNHVIDGSKIDFGSLAPGEIVWVDHMDKITPGKWMPSVHLVVPRSNLLVALVGLNAEVQEFANVEDLARIAREQYGSAPIVILNCRDDLFGDLIRLGYLGVSKIYV
jgi:hypothetical protein